MNQMKFQIYIALMSAVLFSSCIKGVQEKTDLPVLGGEEALVTNEDGKPQIDTLYPDLASFEFMNQDSQIVTGEFYNGKIYVTDFFFTSCPTICPKMTKQMLRLYRAFETDDQVYFLSHSIDTRNDSVPKLKAYATKLEVEAPKWNFVTGKMKHIQAMAEKYMVVAGEDDAAPGGYMHSGHFVLIDGNHKIRGYYDGTVEQDVDQLASDIELLKELENAHR